MNCGRQLLAGLTGGLAVGAVCSTSLGRSHWDCLVAVARLAGFGACTLVGGVLGGASLWASSIWLTLEELDLVLMVGAGDGETGGDGDSSPMIAGIGMGGGITVLFGLRAEVSAVLRAEGVVPYSSTRDTRSSSCCVSVWL